MRSSSCSSALAFLSSGRHSFCRWRRRLKLSWQRACGPVTSLRNEVECGHVESKYAYFDDEAGRMRYGITHNESPEGQSGGVSGGIRVSKALWSSLEAPDERSESSKVSDQYRQSIHRENQAITRGDGKAAHAARKRSQRLFDQLKALREKRSET